MGRVILLVALVGIGVIVGIIAAIGLGPLVLLLVPLGIAVLVWWILAARTGTDTRDVVQRDEPQDEFLGPGGPDDPTT